MEPDSNIRVFCPGSEGCCLTGRTILLRRISTPRKGNLRVPSLTLATSETLGLLMGREASLGRTHTATLATQPSTMDLQSHNRQAGVRFIDLWVIIPPPAPPRLAFLQFLLHISGGRGMKK